MAYQRVNQPVPIPTTPSAGRIAPARQPSTRVTHPDRDELVHAQTGTDASVLPAGQQQGASAHAGHEQPGTARADMPDFRARRLQPAARPGHNFADIHVHPPGAASAPLPFVQARPAAAGGGDRYEQEADSVATQVIDSPAPLLFSPSPLQRSMASAGDARAGLDRPVVEAASQSVGVALPAATRAFMESRFQHDFGGVRIHADTPAHAAAQGAQARAFTAGRDIWFGPGQFRPESRDGRHLLAHELTHVLQQTGASARPAGPPWRAVPVAGGPGFGQAQFDRGPDIARGGFNTFYLGADRYTQVMALQIAVQPGDQRVSLTVAALTPGLRNPPLPQRKMLLTLSPTAPLAPRIIGESETELPDGDIFEKTLEIQLNTDPATPIVSVVLHYGRSRQAVPFAEGMSGVWRPTQVETGWIGVNDGLREIAVNFPGEVPGSLWSSEWQPWVHPGLGYGFLNVRTHRFQPYPRGRPDLRAQQEIVRTVIHFIPVVGSLVMAGEALTGRSIWGRQLSTTERALLGAGAVLAEIGPILRVGGAAARTTAAASRLATVTPLTRIQALRLVIGSRYLTEYEMTTLQRLAAEVRAGRALSEAEQVVVNRLVGKLGEGARAAAVRAEVATTTGAARQAGRFTDLSARTSAEETRVGNALARDLNADVVRVPEATTSGVRSGDYLVDDVFFEAYSPQTGNIENLLRQAVGKHQQAGVLVIDLTRTPIDPATVIGSAPRIFGRPEAADLYRLIFVRGDRVVGDVMRSAAAPGSQLPGVLIRGAASGAASGAEPESR